MSKRFVSLVAFASVIVAACSDEPAEAPHDAGVDAADAHADVADTAPPIDANAVLCDCVKWEGPAGDLCPEPADAGADAQADAGADADAQADADADAGADAGADAAPSADASAEAGAPVSFSGNVRWQTTCGLPCGVYPLRVCSGGGCVSIQQDFCAKDFIPAKFDCASSASPTVFVVFDSGASCQVR